MTRRFLGVPWLFAVAYSAVGFSLYFSIGVVAEHGLGLTPLVFLAAGLLFVLATLSYVEGGAMFLERGGSSSLARHAFNEFVSFAAGWVLLIDYVIVIAIAAIAVPHYLSPVWDGFTHGFGEIAAAAVVIAIAAVINALGYTGHYRQGRLVALALADLALQFAVIVAGALTVMHPELLTGQVDLLSSPSGRELIEALAIATIAFAGIEAASDLAPDLEWRPRDLRQVVGAAAVILPLVYAGMAAIALMAVPVVAGPQGPETELAGRYIEEPVLGVVESYDAGWLSDALRGAVVVVAPAVLAWAASSAMLGLSRHVYSLATNRQVPSWLGKLGRRATPYVAITAASVGAFGLAVPGDVRLLAGLYAFGATFAIAVAHLSVIKLRISDPERDRPFRIPFNVTIAKRSLPLPAVAGFVLMALAWLSVVVFRESARWVGGGWLVFGLAAYVVYRRFVERTSLTERVTVPEQALTKAAPKTEYAKILVPVFDTELDEDILSTAGRFAAAAMQPGEEPPRLIALYVVEQPLTLDLRSPLRPDEQARVARLLARAKDIGEEYKPVEVKRRVVYARTIGGGIVEAAREEGVEAIVMGGEEPTPIRGGAIFGGIGGSRPPEIGEATEYVLKNAPCRVLLTAPPEE